jgi:hypothetical protein
MRGVSWSWRGTFRKGAYVVRVGADQPLTEPTKLVQPNTLYSISHKVGVYGTGCLFAVRPRGSRIWRLYRSDSPGIYSMLFEHEDLDVVRTWAALNE